LPEEQCGGAAHARRASAESTALPFLGAADGFSAPVLDKTKQDKYKRAGEMSDEFMSALSKEQQIKSHFALFASN
jgi:hypothetical protein